jgi:site-specific recombinase XerC
MPDQSILLFRKLSLKSPPDLADVKPTLNLGSHVFRDWNESDELGGVSSLQHCPAWTYFQSFKSPGSQQTAAKQLRKAALWLGAPDWYRIAWESLGVSDFGAILSHASEDVRLGGPSSKARLMFSMIRGVVKHSYMLGYITAEEKDKIFFLKPPTLESEKSIGRCVPNGERKEVFSAINSTKGRAKAFAIRDTAVLAMLFFCGLRRSEVAALKLENVNFEDNHIEFKGKGRKVRKVPLTDEVITPLFEWVRVRGPWKGPVFCQLNRYGDVIKRSISGETIYAICQQYTKEQKFSPHDCRRTFATEFIRATRDVHSAQRLLGHKSPTTTRLYDHSDYEVDRDNMMYFSEQMRAKKAKA